MRENQRSKYPNRISVVFYLRVPKYKKNTKNKLSLSVENNADSENNAKHGSKKRIEKVIGQWVRL